MSHYTILNLPSPANGSREPLSLEDIKQGYRLALLVNHPDKSNFDAPKEQYQGNSQVKPSIDAIKLAYTILSDPKSRLAYDRELVLQSQLRNSSANRATNAQFSFHTGEEVIDLDDMAYDEKSGIWYKGCRCGEKRGYIVTGQQLEEEERKGGKEVVAGCSGCSLWVRVGFSVADENGS